MNPVLYNEVEIKFLSYLQNGCVAVRSYAKAAPTKIVYMCQACNKKQLKQDSMVAYLKKTVIVQCVGCHNIDDDLRWLSENNSKQEIVEAFKTHGLKVMGGPRFK